MLALAIHPKTYFIKHYSHYLIKITIKKILSTLILVTLATSLYANFVRNQMFSKGKVLPLMDTTLYGKRIPISFKSGQYTIRENLMIPRTSCRKFPVIIFNVGSGVSFYRSNHTKFLDSLLEKNLPLDSIALLNFLTKEELVNRKGNGSI